MPTGRLKRSTLDGYALLLRVYAVPIPGHLPVASISAAELIGQPTRQGGVVLSPRSVRQV